MYDIYLVIFCLYSKKNFYSLRSNIGCEFDENLGTMNCYTYLDALLDFFLTPLMTLLALTAIF
ncbi:hypothetical protein B6S12_08400 [Helicobacter valdiviensis]|uniref:Uncharacterized protein n=1 Tax=Helicobacter valdiviensis TaxID=1458358 RepID=A0A2W6NJM1_9HELI|nr:hypothetical protein B6S12_08400 [Helicobacter valdiviensis]